MMQIKEKELVLEPGMRWTRKPTFGKEKSK